MQWTLFDHDGTLGIDWNSQRALSIDPYLIWGDLSGFRGASIDATGPSAGPNAAVRLALELDAAAPDIGLACAETARWGGSRYVTASATLAQLAGVLGSRGVKRVELGFVGAGPVAPAEKGATVERVGRPVVAVIDFGCAFAHERFRHRLPNGWKTRIAYLWDQGRSAPRDGSAPGPWREVADAGYGQEMTARDIDALIARHTADDGVDEDAVYREARFGSVARVLMHGTHVLDLAAGAAADAKPEDAPTIIFVQLPDFAVDDSSGGSLVTHVLDAFRYILARTQPHCPLVVNLSYGSMAGPHDGSTLLESAMDAVIATAMGPLGSTALPSRYLAVVLPAGNNFEADGHARVRLSAKEPSQTLQWRVLADDTTDTFLEVWYPKRFAGRVEVTVTPPDGPACTAAIDVLQVLRRRKAGEPIAAVIHRNHAATGRNDAMALIALAPTRSRSERPCAAAGTWLVTIALSGSEPVAEPIEVHAWIERDDPPIGSGAPPRQSRFLTGKAPLGRNQNSSDASIVRRDDTCSSIANGTRTVVVGSCLADAPAIEFSEYSSAGPSRNKARAEWPDLVAPSDQSRTLPGVLAAGTRSGVQVRMNGTSVAAPQVARALIGRFLPFASNPPAGHRGYQVATPPHEPIKVQPDPGLDGVGKKRAGRGRLLP